MNIAIKTAALLLSLVGFCSAGAALAASEGTGEDHGAMAYHKQKAVYHMNDAAGAGMALRNVQNHINAVGAANVEIAVVTHGKGIDFLLDDWKDADGKGYEDVVQNLAGQGVRFMVCNNTLQGRKIGKDKVNMSATIVPSGVATVAELQTHGFVYIKP